MKKISMMLSVLLIVSAFGMAGPQTAYAESDYAAIYEEMEDSYPELVDRMLNGSYPVTEDQILNFLDDLAVEVSEADELNEDNFDDVMYDALKSVLFEDGEIGAPVDEHFDFGMMLLTEFSTEVTYALDEGELTGDLKDLSDSISEILLEDEAPAAGGGGGLAADEPEEVSDDSSLEVPDSGIEISINRIDGQSVANVAIDSGAISDILENAGTGSTIIVAVDSEADAIKAVLSGAILSKMAKQEVALKIDSGLGYYILPAGSIDMAAIAAQLSDADSADITVAISMGMTPAEDIGMIQASTGSVTVVMPPMTFEITCTYEDKTIVIDRFSSYIERAIPVPDGLDTARITTAVVLDENGGMQHIPTRIARDEDGKYFAVFSSLTNSTYAVIYRDRQFADASNHWGKADISDMAGRMIIGGVSNDAFEPDRDITRAEFMAIVVRSLGLMRVGAGEDAFTDVTPGDWYYDAVSIAKDCGIATGNGDGTFAPNGRITRQEAMAMIARAAGITGLDTTIAEVDAAAALACLQDTAELSEWAELSAAVCVRSGIIVGDNGKIEPKDSITRAETATIVKRMLVKSGLI